MLIAEGRRRSSDFDFLKLQKHPSSQSDVRFVLSLKYIVLKKLTLGLDVDAALSKCRDRLRI